MFLFVVRVSCRYARAAEVSRPQAQAKFPNLPKAGGTPSSSERVTKWQ